MPSNYSVQSWPTALAVTQIICDRFDQYGDALLRTGAVDPANSTGCGKMDAGTVIHADAEANPLFKLSLIRGLEKAFTNSGNNLGFIRRRIRIIVFFP